MGTLHRSWQRVSETSLTASTTSRPTCLKQGACSHTGIIDLGAPTTFIPPIAIIQALM